MACSLGVSPKEYVLITCFNHQTFINKLGHYLLCRSFPQQPWLQDPSQYVMAHAFLPVYFQVIFCLEVIIEYNFFFPIIFSLWMFNSEDWEIHER